MISSVLRKTVFFKAIALLVLSWLVICIVYFSLRSSPHLLETGWMPDWLGKWADRNGELRTVVPYIFASIIWSTIVISNKGDQTNGASLSRLILGCSILFGLLVVTELWQLFLPLRSTSWGDIGWGSVGILLGLGFGLLFGLLKQFWSQRKVSS
jgi:hypothetical protein